MNKEQLIAQARAALDAEVVRLFPGQVLDDEQVAALSEESECFEMLDDMEARMGIYVVDARQWLIDAHVPEARS